MPKRGTTVRPVGRQRDELTPAQARRIMAALEAIEGAERRWATLARQYGYAATARQMDLTPEAVRRRVLKILGPP